MENTKNVVKVFSFEGHGTRVFIRNGRPWFVARDIADVLGYRNPSRSINDHCKHVELLTDFETTGGVIDYDHSHGGVRRLQIIPKADVFRLIARSHLPSAQRFEEWLFDEVLESIEEHGAYMTPQTLREALTDPDTLTAIADKLREEQNKIKALKAKIDRDEPKVALAEAITASPTTILIGDFAKILRSKGVQTGRDRLFRWLRENGYLIRQECRSKNMPTQKAMEMGLFEVEEKIHHDPLFGNCIKRITKLTGKGQQYFINILCPKAKV